MKKKKFKFNWKMKEKKNEIQLKAEEQLKIKYTELENSNKETKELNKKIMQLQEKRRKTGRPKTSKTSRRKQFVD